jgi:1-acyl-sn-glycerol-3-phosphate acyltransferase
MAPVVVPERVPRRDSAFGRWLGRTVHAAWGWKIEGELPDAPKFVIALAPHTSNWDFIFGAATMFALDIRLDFIGKHTLFVGPLGALLRWMGGIPVDRSAAQGIVGESVRAFSEADERVLVITPEGTRSRVDHFRPGFLHIARGAGVPVLLVALDYARKTMVVGPTIYPGEDVEADRARIEAYYRPIQGKHPR